MKKLIQFTLVGFAMSMLLIVASYAQMAGGSDDFKSGNMGAPSEEGYSSSGIGRQSVPSGRDQDNYSGGMSSELYGYRDNTDQGEFPGPHEYRDNTDQGMFPTGGHEYRDNTDLSMFPGVHEYRDNTDQRMFSR